MRLVVCIVLAAVIGCLGCSGSPGDMPEIGFVSGTVTVDGVAMAGLKVTFQPEGGRPAIGQTDSDGRYELTYSREAQGSKIGKNLVTISTPEPPEADDSNSAEEEPFLDPIPEKYNALAIENPDMRVEVKPGTNEFNWNIRTAE
jgi:hypothetical protein